MNNLNNVYYKETKPENNDYKMEKKDRVFSLILALLCIPFVSLSMWGGFNAGYTLSVVIFLALFSVYLFNKKLKFKVFPYFSLVLSLCSAVMFTYSSDNAIRFFLFLLLTLNVFIWLIFLGGHDIADDSSFIFTVFGGIFGTAFGGLYKSLKAVFTTEAESKKGIGKVLVGVGCAIPAVIVLVALLRSSDAAFDGLFYEIGKHIGNFNGIILKIIMGAQLFPFAVSLGLGLAKNKKEKITYKINGNIDKVFVVSFLSAISFVYLIYIFSQFAYFFNAFKGLLPEGLTIAVYARRGFFEMSAIAAINFVIISLALLLTKKKENGKRADFVNALILFIGVFTLLLIATAVSKMILYIDFFGMTRRRIFTSAFMVFLALLFIAVILRIYINKIPVVKFGIITATIILICIGFTDIDKTVAKYNLYAYEQGYIEDLDVEAMGDLGYGAVPTIYEIYKNEENPKNIRSAALKAIKKKAENMYEFKDVGGEIILERKTEIGSFNLSEYKAQKVFEDYYKIK